MSGSDPGMAGNLAVVTLGAFAVPWELAFLSLLVLTAPSVAVSPDVNIVVPGQLVSKVLPLGRGHAVGHQPKRGLGARGKLEVRVLPEKIQTLIKATLYFSSFFTL